MQLREGERMSPVQAKLETALNEMTRKGQILEALAGFYAESCVFEEADGSRRLGRKAQHDHLAAFFASLTKFNRATLHAECTGGDASLSEWTFDMTGGDGKPIVWNEVLARRWENDRVVSERFYQAR
jgi:ketosteroid isomerase-like protein